MNKEKKARIHAAHEEVWRGAVGAKIKISALLAQALDMLLRNADKGLRAVYRKHGLQIDNEVMIAGMKNYSDKVKAALYWFERDVEQRINEATYGTNGAAAHDEARDISAALAELVCVICDRVSHHDQIYGIIDALTKTLPQGDSFTEEDLKSLRIIK